MGNFLWELKKPPTPNVGSQLSTMTPYTARSHGFDVSSIGGAMKTAMNLFGPPPVNQYINIKDDFYWNLNRLGSKSARQDVPYIILKEKQCTVNSFYTQLAYETATFIETSTNLSGNLTNTARQASDAMDSHDKSVSAKNDGFLAGLAKTVNESNNALNSAISDSGLGRFLNMQKQGNSLDPYVGLYISKPTGFYYVLPYYNDKMQETGLSTEGGKIETGLGPLDAIIKTATGVMGKAASAQAMTASDKSVYTEKFKEVQPMAGASYTIDFHLYNTIDYEGIIKNWQFVYLFGYQNRIGRHNRTLKDLPIIYELVIPGVQNVPYCIVSKFVVSYVGTRRKMTLSDAYIEDGQKKSLTTVIPEAYKVSITIQTLITESKNTTHASLTAESKINTSVNDIIKTFKGLV